MRNCGRLFVMRARGWVEGKLLSSTLLVLCPLLQVQGRLEKQNLGFSKRDLLGDGSDPLSMLAIHSRLIGVARAHGS